MIDILFFDYWTRGIRHFAKIAEGLGHRGVTSSLLHLGSRRGEDSAGEQIIDGVLCKDVMLYQGSIVKALLVERPKVVLLLNNQTEDKIIVRACRSLGIKTVFLMHGVLVGDRDLNAVSKIVDSAFSVRNKIKRIPKYANLYMEYLSAAKLQGIRAIFDTEIHLFFLRIMRSPGKTLTNFWRYSDSIASVAFVYSEDDKELFVEKYGYDAENVLVVGNYNLDPLYCYFEQSNNGERTRRDDVTLVRSTPKYFLYIENGFSDPKYQVAGWTEELVAEEILSIAAVLNRYNFNLHVKLHPSSDYSVLLEKISNVPNIVVYNKCDLARLIIESVVVLGQSSSVLMMALAVNKPIALLSIPPLDIQIRQYLDKKIGTLISSIAEMESFVQNLSKDNLPNLMDGDARQRFIGPFDGKCTSRIVNELFRLMDTETSKNVEFEVNYVT